MKTQCQFGHLLRAILAALFVLLAANFPVRAVDGTWTQLTSGGLWSDANNWASTTIADGAGFTANFNTLDIVFDTTVNLDTPRTIGHLIFGDTDPVGTHAGWILSHNGSSANVLTLATGSGAPTITVNALGPNRNVTLMPDLAGTQGLTKAGAGELQLAGINPYAGTTTVNAGTLLLKGTSTATTGGTILNSTAISIAQGAVFTISNDATNGNLGDRVADGAPITLNGGTVSFLASTDGSTTFSETLGTLNLASGGQNRVNTPINVVAGSASTLTFAALNRTPGTAVSFSSATGTFLGAPFGSSNIGTPRNAIFFQNAPAVDAGGLIGGWATIGGADFAAYDGTNGVTLPTYFDTNNTLSGWLPSRNIRLTNASPGSAVLPADRQINSLILYLQTTASRTVNLNGFTLRLGSGGFLASGETNTTQATASVINGNLTAGQADNTDAELFLMTSQRSNRPMTISANIVNNGTGVVSLVTNGGVFHVVNGSTPPKASPF